MTQTFRTSVATSKKPHVKWGALVISLVSVIFEIALFALNLYANTGKMADADFSIGFLAAYGWLLGGIFLLPGAASFFLEDFLPSYCNAKNFEAKENYKSSVAKAIKDSLVSEAEEEARIYAEFLEEINYK